MRVSTSFITNIIIMDHDNRQVPADMVMALDAAGQPIPRQYLDQLYQPDTHDARCKRAREESLETSKTYRERKRAAHDVMAKTLNHHTEMLDKLNLNMEKIQDQMRDYTSCRTTLDLRTSHELTGLRSLLMSMIEGDAARFSNVKECLFLLREELKELQNTVDKLVDSL